MSCLNSVPWMVARAACLAVGARLCTDIELIYACGTGTGCQHDSRWIWSGTYDPSCGLDTAPTQAPIAATAAPTTQAPTAANNCPGYKIQSGAGGVGGVGGDVPRYAAPTERHEVTCCSDIELTGYVAPFTGAQSANCPVWAERGEESHTFLQSQCGFIARCVGGCFFFLHKI
jgi:hypothetical protein